MVAGGGSGGGGGRGGGGNSVGGRHGEVDWFLKRIGPGFFTFGFLLFFFLASVTKGASECLPLSSSRMGPGMMVWGIPRKRGGRSPKGHHIAMFRTTVDRHQRAPSQHHSCPMWKGYFCLYLQGEPETPTVQGTGRIHNQAVWLQGQNFMGSGKSVTAKEGWAWPGQVGLLPPPSKHHGKCLNLPVLLGIQVLDNEPTDSTQPQGCPEGVQKVLL